MSQLSGLPWATTEMTGSASTWTIFQCVCIPWAGPKRCSAKCELVNCGMSYEYLLCMKRDCLGKYISPEVPPVVQVFDGNGQNVLRCWFFMVFQMVFSVQLFSIGCYKKTNWPELLVDSSAISYCFEWTSFQEREAIIKLFVNCTELSPEKYDTQVVNVSTAHIVRFPKSMGFVHVRTLTTIFPDIQFRDLPTNTKDLFPQEIFCLDDEKVKQIWQTSSKLPVLILLMMYLCFKTLRSWLIS